MYFNLAQKFISLIFLTVSLYYFLFNSPFPYFSIFNLIPYSLFSDYFSANRPNITPISTYNYFINEHDLFWNDGIFQPLVLLPSSLITVVCMECGCQWCVFIAHIHLAQLLFYTCTDWLLGVLVTFSDNNHSFWVKIVRCCWSILLIWHILEIQKNGPDPSLFSPYLKFFLFIKWFYLI